MSLAMTPGWALSICRCRARAAARGRAAGDTRRTAARSRRHNRDWRCNRESVPKRSPGTARNWRTCSGSAPDIRLPEGRTDILCQPLRRARRRVRPIHSRPARPESLYAFRISSSCFRALPVPVSSTQAAPAHASQAIPPCNTAAKLNVKFVWRVPMQSFEKRLRHNINLRSHCGRLMCVVAVRLQ